MYLNIIICLLGMIKNLDDSVAEVFNALHTNNMLDNTIFVFVSDNGAPTNGIHRNYGSNWPLKGVSFDKVK